MLKESLADRGFVALALIAGTGICFVPLQHFMPLSRYQHYSFSLSIIAAGLLLQSLAGWRTLGLWGRLAMLSAALFIGSCACFFFNNPWLGNPDLATDEQLFDRQRFIVYLSVAVLPVSYCWIRFGRQKQRARPGHAESSEEQLFP